MRTNIPINFPNCTVYNCLGTSNSTILEIFEPKNAKCFFIEQADSRSNFTVLNPTSKEIYFLSIDKCIFLDSDPIQKCDFAVFDADTFCMVEVKDTLKRKKKHKDKSTSQLKRTIIEFRKKLDFSAYNLEAIISWRYKPKRPLASTNMQSKKLEFLSLFDAKLYEGNQKTF